jgi:hypothetical protein
MIRHATVAAAAGPSDVSIYTSAQCTGLSDWHAGRSSADDGSRLKKDYSLVSLTQGKKID